MPDTERPFLGAKLLLHIGGRLLLIRRDVIGGLIHPGALDLPGGGREGNESAEACVLRETREEVGLALTAGDLSWRAWYDWPDGATCYFAAHLRSEMRGAVRLGSEGTGWQLVRPEAVPHRGDVVPRFRDVVRAYLAEGQF